jgi:hypothetical protein
VGSGVWSRTVSFRCPCGVGGRSVASHRPFRAGGSSRSLPLLLLSDPPSLPTFTYPHPLLLLVLSLSLPFRSRFLSLSLTPSLHPLFPRQADWLYTDIVGSTSDECKVPTSGASPSAYLNYPQVINSVDDCSGSGSWRRWWRLTAVAAA